MLGFEGQLQKLVNPFGGKSEPVVTAQSSACWTAQPCCHFGRDKKPAEEAWEQAAQRSGLGRALNGLWCFMKGGNAALQFM